MGLGVVKKNIIMRTLVLFAFLLVFSITSFSQNTFYIGEQSYPCTEEFYMECSIGFQLGAKRYGSDIALPAVKIIIAKNETQGLFVISIPLFNDNSLRIKGKLMIYLEDGSVISCIDRGINDYVDNTTTTVYYLSYSEIQQMKNSNISKIRFSVVSNIPGYTTNNNNYTASFPYQIVEGYYESGQKDFLGNPVRKKLVTASYLYVTNLVKDLFQ